LTSNDVPLDSETSFIRDISDRQSQVDLLDTQIEDLEVAMARLTRKRDEIADQARQHRAIVSPVPRVPPELVCEILAVSLSTDNTNSPSFKAPWHLGHIFQSWRRTVLAYPARWSSITIH
ncbi:hypothetical protein B0H14DRAFT_2177845, partial [Mycena olivaceomarginata]